jgi:hypothetical protein
MRPAAWIAGVAVAGAITLGLYVAWPTGAAHVGGDVGKKESLSFTRTGTFSSPPLHRCVKFTLTGTFEYTFLVGPRASYWTHQRLVDPGFAMTVRKLEHGRCTVPAKLTAVQLDRFWTGYPCQVKPAMSTNEPYRLATFIWPGCGNRQAAGYEAPKVSGSRSTFAGTDFGAKVRFADVSEPGSPATPPCYSMLVAGDIYSGNSSDSFNAEPSGASKKICLSKT